MGGGSVNIIFQYGRVLNFNDLPPNSIALDGAVQGPQIDNELRRYSFDHHGGCLRMVTLSTCEQVLTALQLGLMVDQETQVFVNDLDADTFMSLWLLMHPQFEYINRELVKNMVADIGKRDSHGPIFPAHPMHDILTPSREEKQDLVMIDYKLGLITKYISEDFEPPRPFNEPRASAYGWSPQTSWQKVEVRNGFEGLYLMGFLLGVLYEPSNNNTTQYTIGKRSDLVPVKVGPASVVRPAKTDEDYDQNTILGALAIEERKANKIQTHEANWGGGSSIGGSPRNPGQVGSILTPQQVVNVCMKFTPK